MRLIRFSVQGFRSYLSLQALDLDPHITTLVGRNDVGKTALLRSIRLPSDANLGRTSPGIQSNFSIEYTWKYAADEVRNLVPAFDAFLAGAGQEQSREAYSISATFIQSQGSGLQAPWGVVPSLGNLVISQTSIGGAALRLVLVPTPNVANMFTMEVQGLGVSSTRDMSSDFREWLQLVLRSANSSYYLKPRRQSTPSNSGQAEELASDGSNLTKVVETLVSNHRRTKFAQLQAFMRAAFPSISDIDARLSGDPSQATIFVNYGNPDNELAVPLEQCGTGVEQMLMLATGILTASSPRLFLIDEPHAYLHPSAERSLLKLLRDHPEHQYIVATHSPVFLNMLPLTHARLITIDGTGSHINDVQNAADILSELDITASDLWSADAILWVEGSSDVKAVQTLIESMPDLQDLNINVLPMPDWLRSSHTSPKNAQSANKFYQAVHDAIAPFSIPTIFQFDGDEKSATNGAAIRSATDGRARSLPVRELENLFLLPTAIHTILGSLCETLGVRVPSLADITDRLNSLLADTQNRDLYKTPPPSPNEALVVGSAVLGMLWQEFSRSEYDKVAYCGAFIKAVLAHDATRLEPLQMILQELAAMARVSRQP